MANIYVRSSDGSDADSGATWALAKATLAGAAAIDAAGDVIMLASTHNELSASGTTLAFAGTSGSPVKVISAVDSAEPPTDAAVGALVRATSGGFIFTGPVYVYGVSFQGVGAHAFSGQQAFENCTFQTTGGGSANRIHMGYASSGDSYVRMRDCHLKLADTLGRIDLFHGCFATWEGGSLQSGSTCANLITYSGAGGNTRGGRFEISGVDLSAGPTGMNIADASGSGNATITLRSCRMPSGWTGSPIASGSIEPALRVEMWNCSAGSDNVSYWMQEPLAGEVKSNTSVYSSDFGTGTAHSLRFTSTANTNQVNRLVGPDMMVPVAAGSALTASVEVVTDNVTLTDGDVALEVMAMSTSGTPLGTWVSSQRATPLTTAANYATSSNSWTTTGLTTPIKQTLSVSVTPQVDGYLVARVVVFKASTVVYVDPALRAA